MANTGLSVNMLPNPGLDFTVRVGEALMLAKMFSPRRQDQP